MEKKKLEEYQEIEIANFTAITGEQNIEIAMRYLSANGWDSSIAASEYSSEMEVAKIANEGAPPPPGYAPPRSPFATQGPASSGSEVDYNYLHADEPSGNIFISLIGGIASLLLPKKWVGYEAGGEEFVYFLRAKFPGMKMPNFFIGKIEGAIHEASLKNRPLLIYIHKHSESPGLRAYLEKTLCSPEAIETINNNFIIFGVNVDTYEGARTKNFLGAVNLPYITMRIAVNDLLPHTLNTLDEVSITKEQFLAALTDAMINYPVIQSQLTGGSRMLPTSHSPPRREVIRKTEEQVLKEIQEQEYQEAKLKDDFVKKQKMEEQKKKTEEEDKKRKEQEQIEKQERERQAQKEKKLLSLPPEPEPSHPNCCEIAFRLTSGRRVSRRFLKTNKVETLYAYVESLGEEDLQGVAFELSQPMPRKRYSKMDATLEEEHLFPKALVQVGIIE